MRQAVVPGSNPASLTKENSEDRQSVLVPVYSKISRQRGKPPPETKKEKHFFISSIKEESDGLPCTVQLQPILFFVFCTRNIQITLTFAKGSVADTE